MRGQEEAVREEEEEEDSVMGQACTAGGRPAQYCGILHTSAYRHHQQELQKNGGL